jgi:hypothetical protein
MSRALQFNLSARNVLKPDRHAFQCLGSILLTLSSGFGFQRLRSSVHKTLICIATRGLISNRPHPVTDFASSPTTISAPSANLNRRPFPSRHEAYFALQTRVTTTAVSDKQISYKTTDDLKNYDDGARIAQEEIARTCGVNEAGQMVGFGLQRRSWVSGIVCVNCIWYSRSTFHRDDD